MREMSRAETLQFLSDGAPTAKVATTLRDVAFIGSPVVVVREVSVPRAELAEFRASFGG